MPKACVDKLIKQGKSPAEAHKLCYPKNKKKNKKKISSKSTALGGGFSDKKTSDRNFNMETLWNLIGNPTMSEEGKIIQPYQRADFPIGKKTSISVERGSGLFGQWERPDWIPSKKKDIRLTLSRKF